MTTGCAAPGYRLDGCESAGRAIRIVDAPGLGGAVAWRVRRSRFVCRYCGAKRLEQLPAYVDVATRLTARAHLYIRIRRRSARS